MTTRRWSPFAELSELRHQVDRLFDGLGSGAAWPVGGARTAFPALNVWEDNDNLYAEAEIPGVSRDALEVYAVGNELTIKGNRAGMRGENLSYHRQERGTGDFARVITLPVEVNADRMSAVLKDGVLTITMPKAPEAKPRKIAIKAE